MGKLGVQQRRLVRNFQSRLNFTACADCDQVAAGGIVGHIHAVHSFVAPAVLEGRFGGNNGGSILGTSRPQPLAKWVSEETAVFFPWLLAGGRSKRVRETTLEAPSEIRFPHGYFAVCHAVGPTGDVFPVKTSTKIWLSFKP